MSRRRPKYKVQPRQPWESEESYQKYLAYEPIRLKNLQERDEARRMLFTAFDLWTICDDKRCVRAKACRGDTDECVMKRWRRAVPDEVREYVGKFCQNMAAGMTHEEAIAATEADIESRRKAYEEIEAKRAAQLANLAPAAAPDARCEAQPPAPPPFSGPRIRSL